MSVIGMLHPFESRRGFTDNPQWKRWAAEGCSALGTKARIVTGPAERKLHSPLEYQSLPIRKIHGSQRCIRLCTPPSTSLARPISSPMPGQERLSCPEQPPVPAATSHPVGFGAVKQTLQVQAPLLCRIAPCCAGLCSSHGELSPCQPEGTSDYRPL